MQDKKKIEKLLIKIDGRYKDNGLHQRNWPWGLQQNFQALCFVCWDGYDCKGILYIPLKA